MKRNGYSVVFFTLVMGVLLNISLMGADLVLLGSGDDDLKGELISPAKVVEGADGKIYVLDRQEKVFKVYSPTGKYLHRFGGKGEGPGEAKRMGSFGLSPDGKQLFFTEWFGGHRWITRVNLKDQTVSVFKLNIPGVYGIWEAVMLPKDRFVARIETMCAGGYVKKKRDGFHYCYNKRVVVINAKGEISHTLAHRDLVTAISNISDGADVSIPFVPRFFWDVLKNGNIIFTDGLSTKLNIFDQTGKSLGTIPTPLPEPKPVTAADLEKWRQRIMSTTAFKTGRSAYGISAKAIKGYKKSIHPKKGNLSQLTVTPAGNILMGGKWNTKKDHRTYWLTDAEGKTLCKINSKALEITITKSYIFVYSEDESENRTLGFYKRSGREAQDLKRTADCF